MEYVTALALAKASTDAEIQTLVEGRCHQTHSCVPQATTHLETTHVTETPPLTPPKHHECVAVPYNEETGLPRFHSTDEYRRVKAVSPRTYKRTGNV